MKPEPAGGLPVAQDLGQIRRLIPAPCKGLMSFPQAIAVVCEGDARNEKKIQDIVVCC
jgi:hypothetical protein